MTVTDSHFVHIYTTVVVRALAVFGLFVLTERVNVIGSIEHGLVINVKINLVLVLHVSRCDSPASATL